MFNGTVNQRTTIIDRVCSIAFNIGSGAGGVVQYQQTLRPGTSWTNWSNLYPVYDEFVVIGGRISILPVLSPTTAANLSVATVVYDNDDDATPLASTAAAADYRVKRIFTTTWTDNRPVTLMATAYSSLTTNTGLIYDTTSANPTVRPKSFKIYANGLPASTNCLTAVVEVLVRMRGMI